MILLMSRIGKILFLLLAAGGVWLLCRRKGAGKSFLAVSVILLLIAGLLGEMASKELHPLTDSVTITALGEKSEDASADSVFISGFTVDDVEYPAESVQVLEGKWFWAGTDYAWRNELDTRQPEGTTRSITLAIPVGWERSIHFSVNKWRGLAEIRMGDSTQIVDVFTTESVDLGRSETRLLLENQILRLIVFCAVVAAVFCALLAVLPRRDRFFRTCGKYKWQLIYAGIALCQFVFAVHNSGNDCLWADELCEIGWIAESDNVFQSMFSGYVPNPFFGAFFYFWYKLMPYGQRWLLLPMEFMTAAGIFFTGLCAKEIQDGKAGALACVIAALSSALLQDASYEIRRYSFLFCLSAVLVFLYLHRWQHPGQESRKEIVWISVCMVLFSDMHFFGVIYCAVLFCIDVYFYFKKRIRLRCIVPYIASAVAYLPVLISAYSSGMSEKKWEWMAKPTVSSLRTLINYLCGNEGIVPAMLFLGVAWAVFCVLPGAVKQTSQASKREFPFYLLVLMAGNIAVVYVYGHINPSFTIWVERYFLSIAPLSFVLAGCGASFLCDILGMKSGLKNGSACIAAALAILVFHASIPSLLSTKDAVRQNYRGAADWLYSKANWIYNDDTLVLYTGNVEELDGWNEYYLTRQGRRDPIRIACMTEFDLDDLKEYQRVCVMYQHRAASQKLQNALASEFELEEARSAEKIDVYVKA